MIDELHPDEIETVLHRHHIGRLACVADGHPYVVPITYAYAGGAVYARTLPGRKLDALRAEPRVCFEVDERWDDATWRSVVADGVFEEVTDESELRAAVALLSRAMPDAARNAEGGVLFRVRLTTKSGRAARQTPPARSDDGADSPLRGLDLRAGDDLNFPRHDEE